MLEVYDRLIADCQTINQLNVRHLSLELTLTPAEVMQLNDGLVLDMRYWCSSIGNRHIRTDLVQIVTAAWVVKLREFHELSGKAAPEPFMREELLKSVTRYTDGRGSAGKRLVVTFCGAAFRPMMAAPTYLQLFDAATVDVVLVRDYHRKGYRLGITDLSGSIEETFAALPRLLDMDGYERVSILGTSGGAVPGVQFGLATGAMAVVAAGPSPPFDPERSLPDGRMPGNVIEQLAGRGGMPRVTLLYGRESMDRPAVDAVAGIVPATVIEVSDANEKVGHNALLPLLQRGGLGDSLVDWLALPVGHSSAPQPAAVAGPSVAGQSPVR